jgi:hypothetical protein
MYVREPHLVDPVTHVWSWDPDAGTKRGKPGLEWHWVIAFDWALLPMRIGCSEPGELAADSPPFCPPMLAASTYYADVVRMIQDLGQTAPQAPHGNFWNMPYADFVALRFPYRPSSPLQPALPGGTIKLLNVGQRVGAGEVRPGDTNFIKALRDGKDVLVDVPGRAEPVSVDIARMPKDNPAMNPNDIARIEAWIALGMPEKRPAPATSPEAPVGNGGGSVVPPVVPPVTPPVSPNGTPPANGGEPAAGGTIKYADVQAIIKGLAPKWRGSPHGNFWEKPYAEFVDLEFEWGAAGGTVRLIKKGDGANSNLVRALRMQPLIVDMGGGKTQEIPIEKPMPPNGKGAKMSDADIEKLVKWIDAGAPER